MERGIDVRPDVLVEVPPVDVPHVLRPRADSFQRERVIHWEGEVRAQRVGEIDDALE
jgi:hypothetical protein